MRIRRKPWARPELEVCPFFIEHTKEKQVDWKSHFARPAQPFWVELGCGKGVSTAQLAAETPTINLLAMDIKSDVLGVAKRNAEQAFARVERPVDNLLLTACNIEQLRDVLGEQEKIDRLLINFCNPWPKAKGHKHRLTHTRQLLTYKTFMRSGCPLVFKTDDDDLFEASKKYLAEGGFAIRELLWDLPLAHPEAAFLSEHETLFRSKGLPIHYILSVME